MINEIFTVVNNKLEISPENLQIPEYATIWERDTTPDKAQAIKEFLYIWHLCSFKSIYRQYPQDKQESQIIKDFIKIEGWQPDPAIKVAVEKWKSFRTDEMRFLEASIIGCNKMIGYFNNIDFSERDDSGKVVYKITEVANALEKAGKILQSLEVLKEKVDKQMTVTTSKIRGGGNVNNREH